MAAMTAITPSNAGTVSTGTAVAASDTIAAALLGNRGAILEIINGGGSTDNITITDAGTTPAGNALASGTYAVTVANASQKAFYIRPDQVTPATGLITITHSFTTSVTYKLYPIP